MVQEIVVATTPAPDTLVNFIYALTEGNPFFIEEVLQTLLVNDSVRYDNGTWGLVVTSFCPSPVHTLSIHSRDCNVYTVEEWSGVEQRTYFRRSKCRKHQLSNAA